MPTRREIILAEIARWRDEGLVDDAFVARMHARYAPGAGVADDRDEELVRAHAGADRERGSFAANAMQLVGGLLLGAALVALVFFLDLEGRPAAAALLLFGAAFAGGGVALSRTEHARDRDGLVEALLAAGLVPAAVSPFAGEGDAVFGFVGAALALAALVFRRGRGPSVLVAGAAFVPTSLAASGIPDDFDAASTALWLVLLLAYGGLMLAWRREAWTSAALGLFVAPLTAAFVMVIMANFEGDNTTALEVVVGVFLGALLGLGLWLDARGLVAGAAAGLTVDAVVFAADLGGPGTAVVVLLALGGLLVWQAETVRGYFRRREAPPRP